MMPYKMTRRDKRRVLEAAQSSTMIYTAIKATAVPCPRAECSAPAGRTCMAPYGSIHYSGVIIHHERLQAVLTRDWTES